jgi:hypothetical protein
VSGRFIRDIALQKKLTIYCAMHYTPSAPAEKKGLMPAYGPQMPVWFMRREFVAYDTLAACDKRPCQAGSECTPMEQNAISLPWPRTEDDAEEFR